jgi:hypothetical protein
MGKFEFCPMSYYCCYVLGYPEKSNFKADAGTVCHKVLEIIAGCKLARDNKQKKYNDNLLGIISTKPHIEKLIQDVFDNYSKVFTQHNWTSGIIKMASGEKVSPFNFVHDTVIKTLEYNNGQVNPDNLNIVTPEQTFDIVINEPWAQYDYGDIKGFLGLKGTIDLIVKIDNQTYEIIDWKTGVRTKWNGNSDEKKDYEYFQSDPQLRLYHLVATILYPDIENIMVSIMYPNDGGLYTMCYDKKDIDDTKKMIRKKFEEIRSCTQPQLNVSWKCTKLCSCGKTTFEDTHVKPIIAPCDGRIAKKGQALTKCEQIDYLIGVKGIDWVTKNLAVPGFDVGFYQAPGGL